ncbi:hypothetical protein PSPTOT1_1071 [Pseudomonas syringae pv. tomato T1]|nr:hypothetical protein PSPTOT1_1071 [Pseudomonas syringae pv. tomato T1]
MTQSAQSCETMLVAAHDLVVLITLNLAQHHWNSLPLFAFQVGQHVLTATQHPVRNLGTESLAKLGAARKSLAELIEGQLANWMPRKPEKCVQLRFAIEHRRARQQVAVLYLSRDVETVACPSSCGLLESVSLVNDHHGETARVHDKIPQPLVVHDDPACIRIEGLHGYTCVWVHHQDLALPVDDQAVEHDH